MLLIMARGNSCTFKQVLWQLLTDHLNGSWNEVEETELKDKEFFLLVKLESKVLTVIYIEIQICSSYKQQ